MPMLARAVTPAGMSPSPHALSSGGVRLSTIMTDRPARRAWMGVASPAGPAPTMRRSARTVPAGPAERPRRAHHAGGETQRGDPTGRQQGAREIALQRGAPAQLAARG